MTKPTLLAQAQRLADIVGGVVMAITPNYAIVMTRRNVEIGLYGPTETGWRELNEAIIEEYAAWSER